MSPEHRSPAPDRLEEARALAREGRCWYCLHPVEGAPNWRFCRRMEPLVPEHAEEPPSFYHDGGRPIHFALRGTVEGLRAHAECHWLNGHAIQVPEGPEELEALWDDEEGD